MFLQRYFSNIFISTLVETKSCRIFAQVVKNRQVVKTFEAVFENEDDESVDNKAISYIKDISKDYNAAYLAFSLNSIGQGAFKGNDFKQNSVDEQKVISVKMADDWTTYASYIDINWAKDMFKSVGVDLLYSPFVFMYEQILKSELKEDITLYIYNFEDSFALGIFDKKELLYGGFFKTKQKSLQIDDIDEIDADSFEEIEKIEHIDLDEHEEEYESLEDLDDTLDFEFTEELPLEESDEENSSSDSLEFFGRDMTIYKYIIESIKEFYARNPYSKKFVENIVIFDNHEITQTVINMLKNEQFMNVEIFKVNALKHMCDLAIKDINL